MHTYLIFFIVLTVLTFVIAAISIPRHKLKPILIALAIIALGTRFGMTLYLNQNGPNFGNDSYAYHKAGIRISQQLSEGIPVNHIKLERNHYSLYVGFLYKWFGPDRIAATSINALLAVLAGVYVFRMVLKRTSFMPAALMMLLVWFFPNFYYWQTDLIKDPLNLFLNLTILALADVLWDNWGRSRRYVSWLFIPLICILIWISSTIRFYIFIPLGLGLITQGFIYILNKKHILVSSVFIIALCVTMALIYSSGYAKSFISNSEPLKFAQEVRDREFVKGEQAITGVDISSPMKALLSLPGTVWNYMVQPSPAWLMVKNGYQNLKWLIQIDMIIWYVSILLGMLGIYHSLRQGQPQSISIMAFCMFFLGMNALLVGNVGAIYRYRMQLVVPYLVLTGCGIEYLTSKYIKAQK